MEISTQVFFLFSIVFKKENRYSQPTLLFLRSSFRLKRLFVIAALVCLLLSPLMSMVAAKSNDPITANGAGVFVHEHEGVPHTHYFVFAVSSASGSPQGHFSLVCKHDDQIETIIFSTQINSITVQSVVGGLEVTFSGTANVKMGTADFTPGWTFTVTAFDYGKSGDQIGVTLTNPQGQVHCTAEPTPLTLGHITINTQL
jgi:hypothetical protein